MKILVIVDKKLLAESIKGMLERKGFQVEAVYDGETVEILEGLTSGQTIHDPMLIPGLEHVTDLNFTYRPSGGIDISGSKLTLNVACRNYMKHTGASIVDAFKVGSYNPAKAVGLHDRGEIRVGKRADLIFVDIKMNIHKVILGGHVVD